MADVISKWVRYYYEHPGITRFELPEDEWNKLRAEVAGQLDGIPWVADMDEDNFLFKGLPVVIRG